MKLVQLWHYEVGDKIYDLTFSDNGHLGATSWDHCAYVFNQNGKLLNKVCGNGVMNGASYCCGRFGFINDDGYVYITDKDGNLIKRVDVEEDYSNVITMTEDGFVACWKRCAFFNFNGNKLWDLMVGDIENGPSYHNGYWYVADTWGKLLIVKDGNVISEISYGDLTEDTAVCGNYLVVSTDSHLYLYNIDNPADPKEIWKVEEFNLANQVVFSPDCKHIAVTEIKNHKLKILDIEGNLVLEKEYNQYEDWRDQVWAVAWWRDRLAVGLGDEDIYVYKVIAENF